MKTLTILVLYDKDGVIDEYIFCLIKQLKTVSNRIIAVINGVVREHFHAKLLKTCEDVVIRDNKGLDAGAYKFILMEYLSRDELTRYDRMIFCNDTFYGFLHPIDNILKKMKSVDCFGISYTNEWVEKYIHSYFLVFNKKIIKNKELFLFFEAENRFNNYANVSYYFERKIFDYLTKKNYSFSTLMDVQTFNVYRESDKTIEQGYPILKKKAFIKRNYNYKAIMNSLKLIVENTTYDVNLILSSIKRQFDIVITEQDVNEFELDLSSMKTRECMITEERTKEFIENISELYIYGVDGCLTKVIMDKFALGSLKGFVVSEGRKKVNEYEGYPVYEIQELVDNENVGIIVALYYRTSLEVESSLERFKKVLYLWE